MPDNNNLSILQRLQSISNMTPTGDNYFDKRKQQIVGGEDLLAPDELTQMEVQSRLGGGVSRDMIRDSGIAALRQRLGLQKIQHDQEVEKETAPEIIRGEYGVRQQEAGAKALADRLRFSTDATAQRQEDNQAAIMARLDKTIGAQGQRQEDQQQFKIDHPSAAATGVNPALYTSVQKAQAGYGGAMSRVQRMLGMDGGKTGLNSALTALLDKKGTLQEVVEVGRALQQVPGNTIDERITNSGVAGFNQLDPYERQYLALTLGM